MVGKRHALRSDRSLEIVRESSERVPCSLNNRADGPHVERQGIFHSRAFH